MGTDVTSPPLIADLIELFVILCLIITIGHAVFYYINTNRPLSFRYFLPNRHPHRIKFFKEPFYTDNKQIIPYKNLFSKPNYMLSIVIPVMNCGHQILNSFETIYSYFNSRLEMDPDNTFEMLIVDNRSNDESLEIYFSFARRYQNVSVLVLGERRTPGDVVAAGLSHAEGKEIFLFFPVSVCPLSEIEILLERAEEMGDRHVIFPTLRISESCEPLFSSTLFRFMFWIQDLILGSFDLEGFAPFKTHSMLISRKAALEIIPSLSPGVDFDEEIVILSAIARIPIDAVEIQKLDPVSEISYIDFIVYIITLFKFFFLYQTHLRKLYHIPSPMIKKIF